MCGSLCSLRLLALVGKNVKASYRLAKTQLALRSFNNALDTIDGALQVLDEEDDPKAVRGQRKAFLELKEEATRGSQTDDTEENLTSIKEVSRNLSIREFVRGKELGVGNFSEIVQCRHKRTDEVFALKMIDKKQAADLGKRQHPNVFNEIQMERRALLERLPQQHPNIVRMYHAFQDYNTLYYLMDLHVDGGDMWSTLRYEQKMVGCHRSLVKVYLAELLDAMEHMHSHGIVHRDLKTENMLLTGSGHLLVIDFGTAKDLIQTDLNGPEFVGTPDFMSPEAVDGTSDQTDLEVEETLIDGADHTADLWAFGAVAFQMMTGQTPFWSPSSYLTFLRIKRGNVVRPWGIADDEAWDLIRAMMQVQPSKRLGADCFKLKGNIKRTMVKKEGGYDVIRNHPYFTKPHSDYKVPGLEPDFRDKTPVPSLRDLCVRACAELVRQDSLDLDLCDRHPPGDGSSHDVLRLDDRDRKCVLHMLERRGLLTEPTVYRRFFNSQVVYRLDKVRVETRDFVGLTRMTDDQGKFPHGNQHDPYADPKPLEPILIVHLTNPLLVKEINESCDEATRKQYKQLLKKCIVQVNRTRPKMVVVSGFIDSSTRKLLARINDSIPVVVHDGSAFFTFWLSGIQCLAIQTSNLAEDGEQMSWLREELDLCRMAKNQLYVFLDGDPRAVSELVLKRLVRGRATEIFGVSAGEPFESVMTYTANEVVGDDNVSVKSTDSEEVDMDNHVSRLGATSENGLRWITITDREEWTIEFKPIAIE